LMMPHILANYGGITLNGALGNFPTLNSSPLIEQILGNVLTLTTKCKEQ